MTTGSYALLFQAVGAISIIAALSIPAIRGASPDWLLLTALGSAAGWLRFGLVPYGHLSLSPIAFFLALLIMTPAYSFSVMALSVFMSRLLFGRKPLGPLLQEVGEETVPALAAAVSFIGLLRYYPAPIVSFVIALLVYVVARLIVGMTTSLVKGGISPSRFLVGTAKNTAANLTFLGAIAFGAYSFLFERFGYVALVLITVALIEVYHPWKLLSEQEEVLFANLAMIAQAIDIKDPYTARHSQNVARIAVRLARAMGLPEHDVRTIRIGALMHDIGKIGVSIDIIRKPSRLDKSEERAMRGHPVISADIMQPIELLADASEIVRFHHEHWDGSGYPSGLNGEDIPIGSRVILVADAFDALVTDRPYRAGRSKEEAIRVLKEHAGKQFDAEVVRALETILPFI